jgi:hypothetical protein
MQDEWAVPADALQATLDPNDEVMTERFLMGPIPMAWLMTMAGLGGEACRAGLLIWHVSGLRKRAKHDLWIAPSLWQEYFTQRQNFSRALAKLEAAGLIAVDRRPGHRLRVSIRTAPPPPALGTVAAVNAQAATATACGILLYEGAATL